MRGHLGLAATILEAVAGTQANDKTWSGGAFWDRWEAARTAAGTNADELYPRPREWLDTPDERDVKATNRFPSIIVLPLQSGPTELVELAYDDEDGRVGDLWSIDYRVEIHLAVLGRDWEQASRRCRALLLLLRETVMSLGSFGTPEVFINASTIAETLYEPEQTSQDRVVLASAFVSFQARSLELLELPAGHEAALIDITSIPVAVTATVVGHPFP